MSAVNYFCHRSGRQPFATRDRSTNNLLVAFLTFGEGWHNNHHRFPRAARAGVRWWELDPIYYTIRLCAAIGLVWDVREVPPDRLAVPAEEDAGVLSFRTTLDEHTTARLLQSSRDPRD